MKKSNEWYTPKKYIEAARRVMGSITLDPASCKLANQTVKAAYYYTQQENGLLRPWYGNVWLNPPYSALDSGTGMRGGQHKGPTAQFITKLVDCYTLGDITQAIVCVNADMVRPWFQLLWPYPLCFPSRPVRFTVPGHAPQHHFFPTCFAYLGPNEQDFIDEFRIYGTIVRAIAVPHSVPSLWENAS